MKFKNLLTIALFVSAIFGCQNDDDNTQILPINTAVNFQYKTTINVGDEGAAEISAFDPVTKTLFTLNVASNQISVFDI